MYKRRARLLFIHPVDPEKALQASEMATQLGPDWLECRGACCNDYMASPDSSGYRDWPDLAIFLGATPATPLPLAPHAQLRCWQLQEDENWPAMISHKIQGVIGGLRLLARLDAGSSPSSISPTRK